MMKRDDDILLISCYELGHQPFSLASPAARLKSEGYRVSVVDAAIEPVPEDVVRRAGFIGISVPMHTAMRVGMDLSRRIRNLNPGAHLCFYGLYATLNAEYLLSHGADSVIGGEFEQPLCDLVGRLCDDEPAAAPGGPASTGGAALARRAAATTNNALAGSAATAPHLARQEWLVPDRDTLPGLKRYAQLDNGIELLPAGYAETTRGCLHTCLHCPITPVYHGRFFAVPADVVLADVDQQVRMGARHITFGDPDFLNGPTHVLRILRRMSEAHPGLTFDFTTKTEHILQHPSFFPEARDLGGIFVVSAVESVSDLVLERLRKGHTRADVVRALAILRDADLPMRPSLVAFTPWTTLDDYLDLLDFVEVHELVDHIDPVQYTIRLLVPPGSALLDEPDTRSWIGALDEAGFTYTWRHGDARMDRLHQRVSRLVEEADAAGEERDNRRVFHRIRCLAAEMAGVEAPSEQPFHDIPLKRRRVPRLTEAWFC
ncbi:MAG: radical SAM protein [Gemmatimonadetes bacterium]|nr:radical SAM protein [Gemmatimonadota bacterium]MYB61091.1 radical SAM protein [Gemmatimonadota bacterium]